MRDVLIFNDSGTKVIGVKDKSISSITIPEGVVSIGEKAFSYCKSLQQIVLPCSLIIVEKYAFCGCEKLSQVCFYDNIKYIGERCFENCSSLYGVYISGSIEKIGKESFFNCSNLKYVYLMNKKPTSITIDNDWFNPTNISSVIIFIPLSTFNDYSKIKALKGFIIEFDSKLDFDADIFLDLFPQYTSFSTFISFSELNWPSFIKDNLQLVPDYVNKGEKYFLKDRINELQKNELFKDIIIKNCYTKEDVLKRWSNCEVSMFLPEGITLDKTTYYEKDDIIRIENSDSFISFHKNPLNWILNEISQHNAEDVIKKMNSCFFNIQRNIPIDKLIQKAYAQYCKKHNISLYDFKKDKFLCKSTIIKYLRHTHTEYDTILTKLDQYYNNDEHKEYCRNTLHNLFYDAIINEYPWLGGEIPPNIQFICTNSWYQT